ncbi:TonB-dependent receptor [Paraurantiacibacter namhicola]|uniref:Colicin I receptor n=1 Tax=Paraurantiacibacter namhicola TaxID=645517 RepID=A0A1C7D564_9SPHN|nr:TonB-dependent receptor [Paraurantiacibacter namhicola]ANU06443.1 Colicin I receptor precursor [Paraurantiacibacter namhicola]
MSKLKLMQGAAVCALAIGGTAQTAHAQDAAPAEEQEARQGGITEIVVTATKRTEDLQDVPVAVQAIGSEALDQLGVATFDDYLVQLPGVSAGGGGPGQSTIYIRGLASTTPANSIAGVAGLAPNVALYLDEQPVSQPGRNLDVYAADLERVEVLAGPQGTLFGASSQAGTVRLITNKPVTGEFQAKFKAGVAFTKDGESSQNLEAMVNVPFGDSFALRVVGYIDNQGGYIDNVAGTRSLADSARFRPQGTVRENGVPVSAARRGFQSTSNLSGVTFLNADNSALVEENINDSQYLGFRVSARYEIGLDWSITAAHARQGLETDGVFQVDPTLGKDDVQRFVPERLEDNFHNTSWTVEGRVAGLDVVYTGAYTVRDSDQVADYTEYLFVGQYLPYYICDGSVTYPGSAAPSGTCQAPTSQTDATSKTTVFTQELRFNTPEEYFIRATVGGFYSDLVLEERVDFQYLNNVIANPFGGFPANFPQPGVYNSDPGPFPAETIFRNDIRRTDKQFGIFGEVTVDLGDQFSVTLGARYYDVEVDFEGSANGSFCNAGGTDQNAFGTNISDLFDGDGQFTFIGSCNAALRQTFTLNDSVQDIQNAGLNATQANLVFNALRAPDTASTDGFIFKGTLNWTPTDDLLFYATYSEGFRPGLLNRPGGASNGAGFTVPFAIETDEVTNYEIGWKTNLFDNQVRFNGNAFYVDIENLQTTIFDPNITNLFFSDNAANARIKGVEADLTFAPYSIPGLTATAAWSLLDTEITEVLTPTNDVVLGSELAFAPKAQANVLVRYEFDVSTDLTAHIQPQVTYTASQETDIIQINRITLPAWTTFALSAGVTNGDWSLEIFGENLTNASAPISGNFINDRTRWVISRPQTVGARVSYRY